MIVVVYRLRYMSAEAEKEGVPMQEHDEHFAVEKLRMADDGCHNHRKPRPDTQADQGPNSTQAQRLDSNEDEKGK